MAQQRALFLQQVLNQIGSPYRWGGKGEAVVPGSPDGQCFFDCSGLVTWAYYASGGPDWRTTHSTGRLVLEGRHVLEEQVQPGDLAIYGVAEGDGRPMGPSHVMVLVGAGVVVGAACGGDSSTTTLEAAAARGAKVQARASMTYRDAFLGVWRLPFAGE